MSPTYESTDRFIDDYERMTREQKRAFRAAVEQFVEDIRRADGFRPGLRVKGVQGSRGVYEMTWADNGRATWQYGEEVRPGEVHIVWRRVGTHDIFRRP